MEVTALDRRARLILGIAAIAVCVLAFGRALPAWRAQLASTCDLVYETPSLRTIELLRDGRNPYDPAVYAEPPFWITMYTPLYHAVCAAIPADPGRPFTASRVVNLVSALTLAALLFVVGRREPAVALLAFGAFFLVRPVCSNAAILKGDFIGVLASVLGVLAAARAQERPRWIAPAALACALALAAKQSFVAAPAASGLFLLLARPRVGLAFGALFAALVGALAVAAHLAWGPGFWFSIWTAPQNPFHAAVFRGLWREMLVQPVAVLNLAAGAAALALLAARRGRALFTDSPYPLYLLGSAALLVATIGKQGAATNYFHEWELASLLLVAHAARELAASLGSLRFALGAGLLFLGAALAEVALARNQPLSYAFTTREANEWATRQAEGVAAELRAISGDSPRILNLYYAGMGPPISGEICVNDPYLYALLFQSGKLDPAVLQRAVAGREFDGVMVPIDFLSGRFQVAPALLAALRANYAPAKRFAWGGAGFDYLTRR